MSVPESARVGFIEKSDELECKADEAGPGIHAPDVTLNAADVFRDVADAKQHLQEDSGNPDVSQTDAFDLDMKPHAPQSENVPDVQHKLDVATGFSHMAYVEQENVLPHVDAESNVNQSVSNALDDTMQQSEDGTPYVQRELDVGDGDATQHLQELIEGGELDVSQAVADVVGRIQHARADTRSNAWRALLDVANATGGAWNLVSALGGSRNVVGASENTLNLTAQSNAPKEVLDLVGATQHLQEDPTNVERLSTLISRLKNLLLQERETYAFMRQSSQSRNKLESLQNLIHYLESQVRHLQKAAGRRGLKYYLANISNRVRGHEVGRIGQSIESELQSWLDQQSVREVADIISKGSEDAQVQAISSFESVVQKGYSSLLQETILSVGLVEKLAALLAPGVVPWQVAKEAAFALSALIDFNKNIFVSLVLMAKTVENMLGLMSTEPDEHVLMLLSVIKGMISVGHTVVVDEIYAHNGVSKIMELLDHNLRDLRHIAMDCVFELAYYGRVEVVNKMFELEVVEKLALLQQSNTTEADHEGAQSDKSAKKEEVVDPLDFATSWMLPMTSMRGRQDADGTTSNPFANAVTKFALHLSIGTGLRKREKRALKQEFLRQIKEVMEDDAEVANITAEVLWAP